MNPVAQLIHLLLRVLGLERVPPPAPASEVLLYREEGPHAVLERIRAHRSYQAQLWRVSIKGGEPWYLLISLDEIAPLREDLGLRYDLSSPEWRGVRDLLREFPMAQFLLTITWQYRNDPRRYGNMPRPDRLTQVVLMEPVDLTSGFFDPHYVAGKAAIAKIMLGTLRVALRLEPQPYATIKDQLTDLPWLRRLQAVCQKLLYPDHQLQPPTMRAKWRKIAKGDR